jgi:hypothetical protein
MVHNNILSFVQCDALLSARFYRIKKLFHFGVEVFKTNHLILFVEVNIAFIINVRNIVT